VYITYQIKNNPRYFHMSGNFGTIAHAWAAFTEELARAGGNPEQIRFFQIAEGECPPSIERRTKQG